MGILYIPCEGMPAPIGQSHILAYLDHLATGRQIHLLSFEKVEDWPAPEECQRIATRTRQHGQLQDCVMEGASKLPSTAYLSFC